jgi:Tfp pilus assembly protein PilF
MKKILALLTIFIVGCSTSTPDGKYIQWMGDNEIANNYVRKGMFHWYNVEWEKAYSFFSGALEEDPTLFAPHVVLSWLSDGEAKKIHKEKAKQLVKGKNENSQLFVSILDLEGPDNAIKRNELWSKMHDIEPDGGFINHMYAWTIQDRKERINEFENFLQQEKEDGDTYFHILNALGYAYYNIDDKEKAKYYLDEYVRVYAEGYNSHDSLGEYFYNEKDYKSALIHYEKALQQYPFSNSANNKVKELREKLGKK